MNKVYSALFCGFMVFVSLIADAQTNLPFSPTDRGRGSPFFSEPIKLKWPEDLPLPPGPLMPAITDWESDGKPDILVSDGEGKIWLIRFHVNDAREIVLDEAAVLTANGEPIRMGGATKPNYVDITGDGLSDLILAKGTTIRVYPNVGTREHPVLGKPKPLFTDKGILSVPPDTYSLDVADWNRDGLLDLVTGSFNGAINIIVNVGMRTEPLFGEAISAKVEGKYLQHAYCPYVQYFDANGDGNPDLVMGINWGYISCYLNASAAGEPFLQKEIRAAHLSGDEYNVRKATEDYNAISLADLDGDGIIDIVFGGKRPDLFFARGMDVMETTFRHLNTMLSQPPAKLIRKIYDDEFTTKTLWNDHYRLRLLCLWYSPGTQEHNTLFGRYSAHVQRFPDYYVPGRLNSQDTPLLPWMAAQAQANFMQLADPSDAKYRTVSNALQLTGLRKELLDQNHLLLADNGKFGDPELSYLRNLFSLIPTELTRPRVITAADFLGQRPSALPFEARRCVNIFSVLISAREENQFPPDSPSWSIPIFCSCAAHEVNHIVMILGASSKLDMRACALIQHASPPDIIFKYLPDGYGWNADKTKENFRAKGYWSGDEATWKGAWDTYWEKGPGKDYMLTWLRNNTKLMCEAPQEHFATLSNQYFANSYLMFDLCLRRWARGIRQPINQFLYFADVYSCGKNSTYFYITDKQGKLSRTEIPLSRDQSGNIDGMKINGRWYRFILDDQGFVKTIE